MTTATYQIQSLTSLGQWEDEPSGSFTTEAEAEAAMADLIDLGEGWTEENTRVVEIDA